MLESCKSLPVIKTRTSITFEIFTIGVGSENDGPSYEKANGFAGVTQHLENVQKFMNEQWQVHEEIHVLYSSISQVVQKINLIVYKINVPIVNKTQKLVLALHMHLHNILQ